ncbi:MAG: hypothetical protein CM15mP118_0130 [Alphaproteobacteria bacterium]|nr:MAG: hypothetical protein CM15mP118_0130 [Alphaproteobacteria bacterium]
MYPSEDCVYAVGKKKSSAIVGGKIVEPNALGRNTNELQLSMAANPDISSL